MATSAQVKASSKSTGNSKDTPVWIEKAASVAHQTVDQLAAKTASTESTLRTTAEDSAEMITAKKKELEKQLNQTVNKAQKLAKKNPLITAGIAFAAGALLVALIRRTAK